MKISELKEAFPYLYATRTPLLLSGHHGLGKSSVLKQIAKENNMKYFDLRLGNLQDPGDLLGLQDYIYGEDGQKVATKHLKPSWWPQEGEKVLIFLDEINRARRDILQAVFQLVLDFRIHTFELPTECYVVAAMNPPTDDYVVTDLGDKALLSRFCQVKFGPTPEEFLNYARDAGFEPDYVGFLSENMHLIDVAADKQYNLEVEPDRRAAERVNHLLKSGLPEHLQVEIFGGMVGIETAVKMMEYFKNNKNKPLRAEEILNEYENKAESVKKFLTMNRTDLVTTSADNLFSHLLGAETLSESQATNIKKFLLDSPKDVAFGMASKISEKSHEIKSVSVLETFQQHVMTDDFIESFRE